MHWQVRRIKTLLREIERRSETGREPLLSLRLHGGLVDQHALGGKTIPPAALVGYKHIKPGEIVMNRMRAALGLFAAAKTEGLVSPDYAIFYPVCDVNLDYAVQLFRTPAMASVFRLESRGLGTGESGFLRLYSDRFGTIPIPFPPPDEQAAIVRFLGRATGQVDRAIQAKRNVIALLNEQKQVAIHSAVTGGLDRNVPRKPSGISWVGDIPKHWEVLRSKYHFREVDERSVNGDETHLSMSQKLGLVPSSKIEEKRLVSESYVGAKVCKPGDLVFNRLKAHLGVFALAPEAGLVSPDYTVFRAARDLEARYFEAVYRTPACRIELRQRAKGIVQGFWRLYTDDFYDIRLPVPPVDEQRYIMKTLESELSAPLCREP